MQNRILFDVYCGRQMTIPLKPAGFLMRIRRYPIIMKYYFTALVGLAIAVGQAQAAETIELKDQSQKISYSVGLSYANTWKEREYEFDLDVFLQGLKDGLEGKPQLTDEEMRTVLNTFQTEHRAKQETKRKEQGEKNKVEGAAFLTQNKSKPGVKTLPSGLQYKVLTEGSGEIPKSDHTVSVNYRGTLIDGTEFDSSYKRGAPASFSVTGVIKGWTEALQLMKVGSKWQVFIPGDLAYGDRGYGQRIPPNTTLIFEMELLSTKAPEPKPAPAVTSDIIKVPSAEELKKGAKIEVIKQDQLPKK